MYSSARCSLLLTSTFQVAGCVLAARLSEAPHVTVALLEAGNAHIDDPLVGSSIYHHSSSFYAALIYVLAADPMGWTKQILDPEYDWIFRTTPQDGILDTGVTPEGKPVSSFYWARYVLFPIAYVLDLA